MTWGLFLAWLANDTEEWFTIPSWSRANAAANTSPVGPVWLRQEVSPAHTRVAISLMGLLFLAASASGARTSGRSRLFQATLLGFGVHGVGHLALSAAHRGYTPGVATSPTVVIPFSLWAWRELGRAGVRRNDARTWLFSAALTVGALAGVHRAAHALTGGSPGA
ncbi:HXXEE domain-containing protein [Nocardia veterana]|uniref:HXXEE domain-containing protein n=1 Tax=Nocardia veterana TaxID=132249 RepID=A0A7X6RGH0_9NOCA|nr:HXXEE domain-containing protein [Nocardia veterana]